MQSLQNLQARSWFFETLGHGKIFSWQQHDFETLALLTNSKEECLVSGGWCSGIYGGLWRGRGLDSKLCRGVWGNVLGDVKAAVWGFGMGWRCSRLFSGNHKLKAYPAAFLFSPPFMWKESKDRKLHLRQMGDYVNICKNLRLLVCTISLKDIWGKLKGLLGLVPLSRVKIEWQRKKEKAALAENKPTEERLLLQLGDKKERHCFHRKERGISARY